MFFTNPDISIHAFYLIFVLLQRNGIGMYVSADKVTYKGTWVDDKRIGEGEQSFHDRTGKSRIEKVRNGKVKDESEINLVAPQLPSIKTFPL